MEEVLVKKNPEATCCCFPAKEPREAGHSKEQSLIKLCNIQKFSFHVEQIQY